MLVFFLKYFMETGDNWYYFILPIIAIFLSTPKKYIAFCWHRTQNSFTFHTINLATTAEDTIFATAKRDFINLKKYRYES